MIVLWLGVAWASQGVVVQVVDTRAALEASPLVELVDAGQGLDRVPDCGHTANNVRNLAGT